MDTADALTASNTDAVPDLAGVRNVRSETNERLYLLVVRMGHSRKVKQKQRHE